MDWLSEINIEWGRFRFIEWDLDLLNDILNWLIEIFNWLEEIIYCWSAIYRIIKWYLNWLNEIRLIEWDLDWLSEIIDRLIEILIWLSEIILIQHNSTQFIYAWSHHEYQPFIPSSTFHDIIDWFADIYILNQ